MNTMTEPVLTSTVLTAAELRSRLERKRGDLHALAERQQQLALQVLEQVPGASQALDDVAAAVATLRSDIAQLELALPAAEARDGDQETERRRSARAQLERMFSRLERERDQALREIHESTPSDEQLRRTYILCRQAFTLSTIIVGLCGSDRAGALPFRRTWDAETRFGVHAARVPYFTPHTPKPDIDRPWADLLAIARGEA